MSSSYRHISLEQFISETFKLYRSLSPADMVIGDAWRGRYERVKTAMLES